MSTRSLARPLSSTQQRQLIAGLVAQASHREALGPLQTLADAPGLLDYVAERITSLRRTAEPTDTITGRLVQSEGDVGAVLASLYKRYTSELERHRLLDEAGELLHAAQLTSEGPPLQALAISWHPRPQSNAESRLLGALTDRAESIFLESPSDASAAPDLSSALERTTFLPTFTPHSNAALAKINKRLFQDDHEPGSEAVDQETVAVVVGAGLQDELRRVVRKVKRSLVDGSAHPDDIVIAARRWPDRGERISGVLREYGIPAALEPTPRLTSSPFVSAMLALLDVARTDWAYEPLLALLARNEFGALSGDSKRFLSLRAAAEWFARETANPAGRDSWLRLAAFHASRAEETPAPLPALLASAGPAQAAFRAIAESLDTIPKEATTLEWFDASRNALHRLRYEPQSGDNKAIIETERRLAEVDLLARWRGRKPDLLRADSFADLLADIARQTPLPRDETAEGRVRVVSAESAAGITMRRLYVVDLQESSFAGGKSEEQQREATLFRELISRPTESLTLSYAALDDAAQPLHPSPFLSEVERLFPPGSLRDDKPLLAEFDTSLEPLSRREARLAAVGRATQGDASLLAATANSGLVSLPAALRMIDARSRGDSFAEFEGVFTGPDEVARSALNDRYGPDHVWSASQLELYATCPYKFFARQALRIDPVGELSLDVDHRRRGSVAHDALASLLASLRNEGTGHLDSTELVERLRQAIHEEARVESRPLHDAVIAAIEARQAERWAESYPEQQSDFEARWGGLDQTLAPRYFEAKFGPVRRAEGVDRAPSEEPFRFDLPETPGLSAGEQLLLSGVIDRIDVGTVGGETVFGVIDYKTARKIRTDLDQIVAGKQLQPVLYALAAQSLFFAEEGATPVAAGYWGLQDKGFTDAKGLAPAEIAEGRVRPQRDWLETVEAVRQRVGEIVAGIRQGAFPMHNDDEHCGSRCEFRTICRVGHARSLRKRWPQEGEA